MIHKNIKLSVLHMLAKEGLQVTKHGQVEWSLPSSDNKPNNTEQWSLVHCVYFDKVHILPMFRNKSGFSVENLSSLSSFNWTVSGFLIGTFLKSFFWTRTRHQCLCGLTQSAFVGLGKFIRFKSLVGRKSWKTYIIVIKILCT